ncbi:MAG: tetratricopeptide repeat protein [Promethearchaeota archaeon]
MRISIHPELERVWKLRNEGKLEEALQLLIDFEKQGDLTLEDKHYYRYLKGWILFNMRKFQESLRIAEQDYQESKNQNKPLFLIDSIFLKFYILQMIGGSGPSNKNHEIWNDIFSSEKLLKSITQEPSNEVKLREGYFLIMNGYYFFWGASIDKAIELWKKSLAISENYDIVGSELKQLNLWILGTLYTIKGELDLALDFHKKCLDHIKATKVIIPPLTVMVKGIIYNNIGSIYFQKGALDRAIKYFEKSLKILEQQAALTSIVWSGWSYVGLIRVLLYKDSREEAQQCLDHFFQYLEGKKKKPFRTF